MILSEDWGSDCEGNRDQQCDPRQISGSHLVLISCGTAEFDSLLSADTRPPGNGADQTAILRQHAVRQMKASYTFSYFAILLKTAQS